MNSTSGPFNIRLHAYELLSKFNAKYKTMCMALAVIMKLKACIKADSSIIS